MFLGRDVSVQAAEERRDPFVFGPIEASSSSTQPLLTGVLWDTRNPLAVIDGEPVTVGETIAGWRVIAIRPDGVIVQRNSRTYTVLPGSPLPTD